MSYDHYSRVYASIWIEPWKEDARTLAFYLLTGPQRRTEGFYRLPLDYARSDLQWQQKRFRSAFDALLAANFVEHDPETHLVLIVNALKRNGLNTLQVRGVVKAIREFPRTPLLERFISLAETHNVTLWEELVKAFPTLEVSLEN